MDLDEIRQILEMMREHDVAELELERGPTKLRLRKAPSGGWTPNIVPQPSASVTAGTGPAVPAATAGATVPVLTSADEDMDLAIVKSPIVGTFYRASEPGSTPFVETGQTVRKGEVLCIIEAMKLMNEINADCDGEVIKVFAENGQAVQYGERLFAIRPA
jgi:acetyl-CoA carboxylase biotin carboxyl carrier protein